MPCLDDLCILDESVHFGNLQELSSSKNFTIKNQLEDDRWINEGFFANCAECFCIKLTVLMFLFVYTTELTA